MATEHPLQAAQRLAIPLLPRGKEMSWYDSYDASLRKELCTLCGAVLGGVAFGPANDKNSNYCTHCTMSCGTQLQQAERSELEAEAYRKKYQSFCEVLFQKVTQ